MKTQLNVILLILAFLIPLSGNAESVNSQIPEETFSISFSMNFRNQNSLDNAFGFVGRSSYDQYMAGLAVAGNSRAGSLSSFSKLKTRYLKTNSVAEFNQMSLKEKAKSLKQFIQSHSGVSINEGLLLSELAIIQLQANPNQWENTLSLIKDDITFEEKVRIASRLGGKFSNDYNNDRANDRRAQGVVTIEEMLTNISNDKPGGICRDVTLAQSQVLQTLGVPHQNIYQMAYATASGHHAVVIVQDPSDELKVIKINYSYIQGMSGTQGAASLFMDGNNADMGIGYKLYDADGSPVERIPSELGEIILEVTNGERKFEIVNGQYQIKKTVFVSKFGTATLFNGRTSTGDSFTGIGFNRTQDRGNNTYSDLGIAFVDRRGNGRDLVDTEQQVLYGRMRQWMERERLLGPIRFKGTLGVQSEIAIMNSRSENRVTGTIREGINFETHVEGFTGLEAMIAANEGQTLFTGSIFHTGYVDFANVGAALSGGVTYETNGVELAVGVEHNIHQNMIVSGKAILFLREAGKTMTFNAGVEHLASSLSANVSYQVPLNDIPVFFEGSTKMWKFSLQKKISKRRRGSSAFHLDYIADEDTGDTNATFGFELKF